VGKFRGLAKVDQVRFHAASCSAICTEAYGVFKINRLRGSRLEAGSLPSAKFFAWSDARQKIGLFTDPSHYCPPAMRVSVEVEQ
jgi:hypothetical protein